MDFTDKWDEDESGKEKEKEEEEEIIRLKTPP
jgi:hypothetical protein